MSHPFSSYSGTAESPGAGQEPGKAYPPLWRISEREDYLAGHGSDFQSHSVSREPSSDMPSPVEGCPQFCSS